MTCICAVRLGDDLAVVADGMITVGSEIADMHCNKIVHSQGGWGVALSGDWRSAALAERLTEVTAQKVADEFLSLIKNDGWSETGNSAGSCSYPVNAIIIGADPNRSGLSIWEMFRDFTISHLSKNSVKSIGSGGYIANGAAMYMLGSGCKDMSACRIAATAVSIASKADTHCGPPYSWIETSTNETEFDIVTGDYWENRLSEGVTYGRV